MEPPKHLKTDGKALFEQVAQEYSIEDAGGIALLTTAAECLDRMREAQAEIKKHGVLLADRYNNQKLNPACGLEKDARSGFLAAIKSLNLDLEPLKNGPGRPPGR
jgi:P27 family predicted phage terminase small subunit